MILLRVSGLIYPVAAAILIAKSAFAGPPYQTDDPEPPGTHGWEINLPFTMERAADGSLSGQWVSADMAYAFDDWTQLTLQLATPFMHAAGIGTKSSFGDVNLQYGRRFGTDAKRGYFGVAPQVTFPTGRHAYGLSAGRVTADFPLLYQRDIARVSVYTDLRYRLYGGDNGKSYWIWGVAGEGNLSEALSAGAELFGTSPTWYGGQYSAGFNLGLDVALSEQASILFSVGRSFRNDPRLTLYLGLQILTRREGN
jgi:hypothetical protein